MKTQKGLLCAIKEKRAGSRSLLSGGRGHVCSSSPVFPCLAAWRCPGAHVAVLGYCTSRTHPHTNLRRAYDNAGFCVLSYGEPFSPKRVNHHHQCATNRTLCSCACGRHARCSLDAVHSWRASAPPHAGPTPRKDGPPRSLLVSDDEELGSLQTRAAGRRKARGERGVCQPRLARARTRATGRSTWSTLGHGPRASRSARLCVEAG